MRRERRSSRPLPLTHGLSEIGIGALWSAPLVLASLAATWTVCRASHSDSARMLLPTDLDFLGLGELLERIIAMLSRGGAIFALVVSIGFIGTWAVCHLRSPRVNAHAAPRALPYVALCCSAVPVALTIFAIATRFLPGALPLTLKIFGISVISGAISWTLSVLAIFVG
ncbi:MAG: hypothetical protein ACPHRO_14015, partial [Nannocystaceae bacterium]